MNTRALVAALYTIMFLVTLLNMAILSSTILREVAPVLFTSLIMALLGMLLSLWVYRDGENIKDLNLRVETLEKRLREKEKKE